MNISFSLVNYRRFIDIFCVFITVTLVCIACERSASVSGVWREVSPLNVSLISTSPSMTLDTPALYELNLGQYGDRVAGVSVRYQKPDNQALASFDPADRCGCSFVVQGLIQQLENPQDDQLLFVANGLTFSLYTPSQLVDQSQPCPTLDRECQRIFNLEQFDGGDSLEGYTWCLESPEDSRRPIRFESINGLPEDVCEAN